MRTCLLLTFICSMQQFNVISQDSVSIDLTKQELFFIDEAQLDSGEIFNFWGFYFGLGQYQLIDSSYYDQINEFQAKSIASNQLRLRVVVDYMLRHPNYIVEVAVHNDCRGSAASSRKYSVRRAENIVAELVKLGIAADRLIPKGYEESMPYNDNGQLLTCEYITSLSKKEGEALHQKNRRFHLKVISKKYVP